METTQKIAVIGGTGKSGKYLVLELLERGCQVKLLLRNPEKLEIQSDLIEIVQGDVRDYESVYSLVQGCTAVVSMLGQASGEEPPFSLSTTNIITAMDALNVRRYIVITGLTLDAIGDKKSFKTKFLSRLMKLSFPATTADKQKEYTALVKSTIDWTIIRLPLIEETDSVGPVKVNLLTMPKNNISASDLAIFIFEQLTDTQYFRKAPFISN